MINRNASNLYFIFAFMSLFSTTDSTAIAQPSCAMGTNTAATAARRSVAITSGDGIDLSAFGLEKVLGKIIETSDERNITGIANSAPERAALLQSMLRSLARSRATNTVSGAELRTEQRPEAKLTPEELFDQSIDDGLAKGLHPVALFNRFELAPRNYSNCGEHRIVYLLGKNPKPPADPNDRSRRRMSIIFEARVENPRPRLGELGCLPIAQFWKDIETKGGAEAALALREFYFEGKINGQQYLNTPVVHFQNYGFNRGQIRGNLFVTPDLEKFKWQLREWKTDLNPDGSPYFRVEPVNDSPVVDLWKDEIVPGSLFIDAAKAKVVHDNFRRDFITAVLEKLLQPERKKVGDDAVKFVENVAAEFPKEFAGFQSIAQDHDDDPAVIASKPFGQQIVDAAGKLLNNSGAATPSAEEILNRAGAVTCGGCHQFSNKAPIGKDSLSKPITWPESAGFVHVKENGDLSPGLLGSFLVARCRNLNEFIDRHKGTQPNDIIRNPTALLRDIPGLKPEFATIEAPAISFDLANEIATIQAEPDTRSRLEGLLKLNTTTEVLTKVEEQGTRGAFVEFRRVH